MLSFIIMRINIKAINNIRLPLYTGSALRGFFGYSFKSTVCSDYEKECRKCMLKGNCAYSYIFETPVPPESNVMRKYEYVPKPFVLFPPAPKDGLIPSGSNQFFTLTIIGKAIDYLPYFVYSLIKLGEHGIGYNRAKFIIEDIIHINSIVRNSIIYTHNNDNIKFSRDNIDHGFINDHAAKFSFCKELKLSFITPLRVMYKNTPLKPDLLEFHIIIRTLLRRIFLLSKFHGDNTELFNFDEIIESSLSIKTKTRDLYWHKLKRHSSRQKKLIDIGGIMGKAVFSGCFEKYLNYLVLGSYINIGKGTTFGLGKYLIAPAENDF